MKPWELLTVIGLALMCVVFTVGCVKLFKNLTPVGRIVVPYFLLLVCLAYYACIKTNWFHF